MQDKAKLQKHITDIFPEKLDREAPAPDTDLFESELLDSLSFVDLLLHLESEFGTRFSLEDLEIDNFKTVEKIAELVASRREIKATVS